MSESKLEQDAGRNGQDERQGDLRDVRGGPAPDHSVEERSAHKDAQMADVRPDRAIVESDLPAGLQRERKGPLSPKDGRR